MGWRVRVGFTAPPAWDAESVQHKEGCFKCGPESKASPGAKETPWVSSL